MSEAPGGPPSAVGGTVAWRSESPHNRPVGTSVSASSPSPATAFVVLGCRPETPVLAGAALRRVEACARAFLASAGLDDFVVCAGGRAWSERVEADAFAEELVARGIPRARVVRERCSMTTGENARFVAGLLARRGITRVRLVTCAWHMPRAAGHFWRQGLTVVEEPAAAPGGALLRAARDARERAAVWLDERLA